MKNLLLLLVLFQSLRVWADVRDTINIATPGRGGEEKGWSLEENNFGKYVYIRAAGNYVITGASDTCGIMVGRNDVVRITLQNVKIEKNYPFFIRPGSAVTLNLSGINTIKAPSRGAGIAVPPTSKLVIEGDGGLYAWGGNRGNVAEPGIGGYDADSLINAQLGGYVADSLIDAQTGACFNDCGSITIHSGFVFASSGRNVMNNNKEGAAIGSCFGGVMRGNITINGGFVYANGADHACGLGGGYIGGTVYGFPGTGKIMIKGGIVMASSIGKSPLPPQAPDLYEAYPVTTEISAHALVCSPVINTTIFNGATIVASIPVDVGLRAVADSWYISEYGRMTLTDALTVPQGVKFIVPDGFTLDVNHQTLTTNDTIINYGLMSNDEKVTGLRLDVIQESWFRNVPAQTTYTGYAIQPAFTITDSRGNTWTAGDDYTVTISGDNVNVGTSTATIAGAWGIYLCKSFDIVKKKMTADMIPPIPDQPWTGASVEPVVVKYKNKILTLNADYTIEYRNNTDIGTATATIAGTGRNYEDTVSINFNIKNALTEEMIQPIPDQPWTGSEIRPPITVKDGNDTLEPDTDYTVTYLGSADVGTAIVIIEGQGDYAGTVYKSFNIRKALTDGMIQYIPDITYTDDFTQRITVKDGDRTLQLNTDYTVDAGNVNAGTATVWVTGTGYYYGTVSKTFYVVAKSLAGEMVQPVPAQVYTGDSIQPPVTVKDGEILHLNTDYTIVYTGNVNAGTATVWVTGTGNYSGTVSKNFSIVAKALADTMVQVVPNGNDIGDSIKQVIVRDGDKTLELDSDYTVSYSDNAGVETIIVTGIGNYSGAVTVTVTVSKESLAIEPVPDEVYTGDTIKPSIIVKAGQHTLQLNIDYTVSYTNNVNAGTATVTVTGNGDYSGTVSKNFTIVAKPVSGNMIAAILPQVYGSVGPSLLTVKDGGKVLDLGIDYAVSFSGMNVGMVTATVTGMGNYAGAAGKDFYVIAKLLTDDMVRDISAQTWTGDSIKPATVRDGDKELQLIRDYTIAYSDNVNPGTATLTIAGKGNYSGKVDKSFSIRKYLTDGMIQPISDYVYTGNAINPVTVKDGDRTLQLNTDYTVAYSDNINAGKVAVTITGAGNYMGSVNTSFTITPKQITGDWIEAIPDQTYTGDSIEPPVTVKDGAWTLERGKDYTVGYSGNVNVGTATVTVTGAGNYGGTVRSRFNIALTSGVTEEAARRALLAVAIDDGLLISGLTPGETFGIYTLQGQLVYQAKAASPEERIPLHDRGIYILRQKNKTYKVSR